MSAHLTPAPPTDTSAASTHGAPEHLGAPERLGDCAASGGIDPAISCRFATEADAADIIDLVEKVYGRCYSVPQMYDAGHIRELIASGSSCVVLSEAEGHAVGLLVAAEDRMFPQTAQLSSLMTLPGKRFRGSAKLAHEFLFRNFDMRRFRSVFLMPVTFHTGSQRLAGSFGFNLCGVVMNGYMERCVPLGAPVASSSFPGQDDEADTPKRSDLLAVRNLGTSDVGDIFVCESLRGPVMRIYETLGAAIHITCHTSCHITGGITDSITGENMGDVAGNIPGDVGHDGSGQSPASPQPTALRAYPSPQRHNVDIVVDHAGPDVMPRLHECMETPAYGAADDILLTFQVYWNVSEPEAVASTERLLAEGFRFNGLKPLGQREYALFYWSAHQPVDYTACRISEGYRSTFKLIEHAEDR